VNPAELVGQTLLGRYTLREQIAAGGMSVVYAGQDERLHRPVCVKVFVGMDSQHEYQTIYEHFVQEAFALSQLQHPSTIRIYDFGYLDQEPKEPDEPKASRTPFYVSELMGGGTLFQLVKRGGPMTPQDALQVLDPIVHALAEAHGRGIIHRDIKPSNILFGTAGEQRLVKLADFGIAKLQQDGAHGRASETMAKSGPPISLYSAGWAAPEQMRRKPVGPTADVYSLGLVLAFMLSGRKVFPDDNDLQALGNRVAGDQFVEESLRRMQIPPALQAVIARACRTAPAERHQSAMELLEATRHAVAAIAAAEAAQDAALDEVSPDTDEMTPPVAAPSPAAPPQAAPPPRAPGPVLRISSMADAEIVAAGRRVSLVATPRAVDLGGPDGPIASAARARFTFVPGPSQSLRLHIKGLNCFVAKDGGRTSSAVEIARDTLVHLQLPAQVLDSVQCQFARTGDPTAFQFPVAGVTLAVPLELAACAVLLDFGPGREMALLYSIPR
jgi:serine/threonine-protein kinase